MDARKLQVKIFTTNPEAAKPAPVVPIFHRWIKEGAFSELLIDVADYAHVDQGPAVLLVGHESDYCLDFSAGEPGLSYHRKRGGPDDAEAIVVDALRRALSACKKLEDEPTLEPRVAFSAERVLIKLKDRLRAPNTPETFEAARPVVEKALSKLFGDGAFSVSRLDNDPRDLFTLEVKAPGAPPVRELAARLS